MWANIKIVLMVGVQISFSAAFSQSLSYINSGGGITESGDYILEYSIGSFQSANYASDNLQIIRSLFGDEGITVTAIDEFKNHDE